MESFPLYSLLTNSVSLGNNSFYVEDVLKKSQWNLKDCECDGYALLWEAMRWKHLDIARFLLAEGVVPFTPQTCLWKTFCENNPRFVGNYNAEGSNSPLHYAIEYGDAELINIILSKDNRLLSLHHHGKNGDTPLHTAVRCDQFETVKVLMERGSDIDCVNDNNATPVMYSIMDRAHDCVPKMLKLLSSYSPDMNKSSFVKGMNPLLTATKINAIHTVRYLLDHGADINRAINTGKTAILIACENGYEDICRLLIDRGCDVNKVDVYGNNLLYLACIGNNLSMVQFAINKGFEINCRNTECETPLHLAVSSRKLISNDPVIKYLLLHGADPNAVNGNGDSVLCMAFHVSGDERLATNVTMLLEHGADPNLTDRKGNSPLVYAARINRFITFSVLLCYGADVNVRYNNGDTLLSAASSLTMQFMDIFPTDNRIHETAIKWKTLRLVTISDETISSLHPDAPSIFQKYEDKCISELNEIRNFSTDLYLLLTKPIDQIKYNLINENMIKYIMSKECIDRFPLYHKIMVFRCRRADVRLKLLQGCQKFHRWLEDYIPWLCAEKILSYLSNSDLISLSKL